MDPIVQFTVSPEAPLSAKRSYMSDTSARNTRSSKTVSVEMPQLGESIIEGTVTAWLKNLGDQVTDGEPIVTVSTDKADVEVLSPPRGVSPTSW